MKKVDLEKQLEVSREVILGLERRERRLRQNLRTWLKSQRVDRCPDYEGDRDILCD